MICSLNDCRVCAGAAAAEMGRFGQCDQNPAPIYLNSRLGSPFNLLANCARKRNQPFQTTKISPQRGSMSRTPAILVQAHCYGDPRLLPSSLSDTARCFQRSFAWAKLRSGFSGADSHHQVLPLDGEFLLRSLE